LEERVRAEGHKVLTGVEGGSVERALTQQVDDWTVDEEGHGEGQAGVEARPPTQEPLGLGEPGLKQGTVSKEDLEAAGSPTEKRCL